AIQNKVGQFISAPLIRNIIGQPKTAIDMRSVMDEEKIIIVNLSKGKIGEDNSMLLGALLITKLQLAAMSRVDIPENERKDFFLYVDEFQNFATDSFANILSEARKYRLALILGHQYTAQLEESVADAVFGNVGTIVSFRVGAEDAEYLEKEFAPEFQAQDLVNLGKYNIYLKLMIDGLAGRPFSAETLPPILPLPESNKNEIIETSREKYSTSRHIVEEEITSWLGNLANASQPPSASFPGSQQTLYDARCSLCGKDTKVIFPPDGKRPVYCKRCRHKLEREKQETVGKGVVDKKDLPETEKDLPQKISLGEAQSQEVFFSASDKAKKDKGKGLIRRPAVDLNNLRNVLKESLAKDNKEKEGTQENNHF
ncbi:MAG: CxxC-x17-CxxC domain-containing protein, partial [bacterium]